MKTLHTLLLIAAALAAATTGWAQTPTPEAMATPETTNEDDGEGDDDDDDEGDDDDDDDDGGDGTTDTSPQVHGFVTVRYLTNDGAGVDYASENGYDVQYARINIDGKAHPFVKYFVSVDLADVKVYNGNIFREAYVIWAPRPKNDFLRRILPEFRAGRMRKPGGIESFQDESQLLGTDRSLFSGFIKGDDQESSDQDFRDIGIRGNGSWGPIEAGAVGMTNGSQSSAGNSPPDDDDAKDVAGRVGVRFGNENGPWFIRAGMSAASGSDSHTHLYPGIATPDAQVYYSHTAYDLTLKIAGLDLQAEAAYGKRTIDFATAGVENDTATGSAAYLQVGYEVPVPIHLVGIRNVIEGDRRDRRAGVTPYLRVGYREPSMNTSDEDFERIRDWNNEVAVGVNVALIKKRLTARAQITRRSGYIAPHPTDPTPGFNKKGNITAAGSLQAEF